MELKDQIRIAREAAGLSRPELATRLGVSKQSIVWWEDGEHRPKMARVSQIEDVLNVRFDLTERGNAKPAEGEKVSLSVDPEIMRVAVALGRLPKAQLEALKTLIFFGENQALQSSSKEIDLVESPRSTVAAELNVVENAASASTHPAKNSLAGTSSKKRS